MESPQADGHPPAVLHTPHKGKCKLEKLLKNSEKFLIEFLESKIRFSPERRLDQPLVMEAAVKLAAASGILSKASCLWESFHRENLIKLNKN